MVYTEFSPYRAPDGPKTGSGEILRHSTHLIKARKAEGIVEPEHIRTDANQETIKNVARDEANFRGESPLLVSFTPEATEADIAGTIQQLVADSQRIVAVGARTSLTGAAVPHGEVILDMSSMNNIGEIERDTEGNTFITVQAGSTVEDLQEKLKRQGLFLPSAPTYQQATIGGTFNTDAGGARGYKYGKTRESVAAAQLILSSGDILDIERGKCVAHPPDEDHAYYFFELVTSEGESRIIPVPTYTMPDVPKVSAGYYAKPDIDLLDLIIGSEGTLGVVTEVKFKVLPEPPTAMVLIGCENDMQALQLMAEMRKIEVEKRVTKEPGGISAVEFMGKEAIRLIKESGHTKPPDIGHSLLLVQVETPDGDDSSLAELLDICQKFQIADTNILGAEPDDKRAQDYFINVREAIPHTVNDSVRKLGSTKVGADPCVRPDDLPKMVHIYQEEFANKGIDTWYVWGHGEGNLHFNVIAPQDKLSIAKKAVLAAGRTVIEKLQGVGTAEHGVGKHEGKQQLTCILYGEEGIDEMRAVKKAFDPDGVFAPGNIFPLAA